MLLPPWKEQAEMRSRWGWIWGGGFAKEDNENTQACAAELCGGRDAQQGAVKWSWPRTALDGQGALGDCAKIELPSPVPSERPEIWGPVGSRWALEANFWPPFFGTWVCTSPSDDLGARGG